MTYRGHIKGGAVVLDEPVALPEGTSVEVAILDPLSRTADDEAVPTLYERLRPVIGKAKGLPPDAARNVDHYLYGLPKS